MTQQTHAFQADVGQVLDLVVHSLYSNKEIFLRELLSNASDALDKLRFRALTDATLLDGDATLEVRVHVDAEKRTIRIEDTGIGMTEKELVEGLGTIAHSGSRAFLAQMAEAKDVSLIGRFGVGFYSAYLVADRVDVITRAAGPDARAFKWSSNAKDTFTVEPAERASRGTDIVLHLRETEKEFLDAFRIRELVKRYSDFTPYPILLEGKQINQAKALWQRPKSEISDEQYDDFYKNLTHDFEAPLARVHFKVEGTQELIGLLYVPRRAPFDLHDRGGRRGVRLFVKRVFVMDDVAEIVPQWLRFVRGVVDSDDLPLNVSRELLQDSTLLRTIKKQVVKKTLDVLDETAKERPADYVTFWRAFGVVLKESLALGDDEYKDRVAELLRFETTARAAESDKEAPLTSLAEYVARMPAGQDAIYYSYGENRGLLESSPYLEAIRARGHEVLLMTDPVDSWAATGLREYAGKKLVSAMDADLKLDDAKEDAKDEGALEPLRGRIQKVLDASVRSVKISGRLVDSPACLALAPGAAPPMLERLMKGRAGAMPRQKPIFEINPKHPLIVHLEHLVETTPDHPRIDEWIALLHEQALILEGGVVPDPNGFARRIATLLTEVATTADRAPAS